MSAAAWLGEVVAINLAIIPALESTPSEKQGPFIAGVFPRLFRLASVLALLALSSGLGMSYLMTEWRGLGDQLGTRWGTGILIGGALGLLLAIFHFVVESRLRPFARSLDHDPDPQEVDQVVRFLRLAPRIGMLVIFGAFLFMMIAARG